ncbi:uncharacterized protein LOC122022419 [Zingiber officinale]|uniref:Uncharacterized protein n=1 Tax=Zingiber officinale TaxID=94328 RepID=A0A8J5EVV3_ZINOF|nr:uncharacterized protein LOC122022419 [Zingiber officinale]KAG6475145.1 hypothetical protein ZIOFF_064363 [Zingiber officinale]
MHLLPSSSSPLTACLSGSHGRSHFQRKRFSVCALKNDDGGSRLVDGNMVTLRRRIHERRMAENYSDRVNEAPGDWMEWERRYYKRYGSDVSEFMGMAQAALMNARPSVGLATVAVAGLSMPPAAALFLLLLFSMH